MKRTLIGAALGIALGTALLAPASAQASEPLSGRTPGCDVVDSDGSLTYTTDEGVTVTPTTGTLHSTKYTFDIAPLAKHGELMAVDNVGTLFRSRDAGCSWSRVDQVSGIYAGRLAASSDGSAYLWDLYSSRLVHVDGTRLTELPPVALDTELVELVVDPRDRRHLRAVTQDGHLLDSSDAGRHFAVVGQRAGGSDTWLYSATIDSQDLDHVVLGSVTYGSYATWDGGRTWSNDGMGMPGDRVNAFSVEISPADPSVVYAQGINLAESDAGRLSEGRHLYQSRDGGRTFEPILDQGRDVPNLQNGTLLAPSPADPYKVHFVFSTSYLDHGTDLYTLDTTHWTLSMAHDPHTALDAIAFDPRNASVMYLGFGAEYIS